MSVRDATECECKALRKKLAAAEIALTRANELHGIVRGANAMAAVQLAQLEQLAHAVKAGATTHPHWQLARWVRFGPMAGLLATIKD